MTSIHTPLTVLYGDFSCPWSYLAYHRLTRLYRTAGDVEFRAVEHDPWRARPRSSASESLACLDEELGRVAAQLLPGETLPLALPPAVPITRAAVSGYAEAFGADVADLAAARLFESFWTRGTDLSSPAAVRTLLADAVMAGTSPSDPLRRWGHAVDVTGGPMTTTAWRLVRRWREEWTAMEKEVVPVLVLPDGEHLYGVDAVEHLGQALATSGVDPSADLVRPEPGPRPPLDGYGRVQVLYPATGPVW